MRPMADRYPPLARVPTRAPTVGPPGPYVERRQGSRRRLDRSAHDEAVLLARALDVLVSETSAEAHLAGLLELLARTAGARRAAVLSSVPERRVAVSVAPGDDEADAQRLAEWLDAEAPRSRAERAAAGRAPITFVRTVDGGTPAGSARTGADVVRLRPGGRKAERDDRRSSGTSFAWIEIPGTGHVALGFEVVDGEGGPSLADRLPPTLARHAAVVLALVSGQLAAAAELESLRSREAERERFVSTVAHDLRTPLTGLSGYLDLILEGRVDDGATEREFMERSRLIVDSMGDLVGDLLDISRLDSGNLHLDLRPFSVAEVGGRVMTAVAPLALQRGIDLRSDLPPRMRAATGDRREVQRVLTNLVGNALKFSPDGGHVELAGWFDGAVAVIAIRDDGPGIPSEDRIRIFERFQRLDAHSAVGGTGLGLAIARDLTRAMGGDLDVASVPGSGSSFVVVLPGTTQLGHASIDAILESALADEELLLEEAAVLRAIRSGSRPVVLETPAHAAGPIDAPQEPGRGSIDATPGAVEPPPRPVRLRSIDGALSRSDPPDPA